MALRCFLFSSDEGTSDVIRPVITALGVEGESCSEASTAAQRIANELFQIVIVDWDQQPDANMLLSTARERKASERPLTLAIVSDDASVPTALQAGANSILRKPLLLNQVTDTLTTARDLLRSRQPSAAPVAGPSPSELPQSVEAKEKTLRAGEFLQSLPVTPGGQFETDSDVPAPAAQSVPTEVDPLKDLEPVAAAMAEETPVQAPPVLSPDEPRGLEWYLKARGVTRSTGGGAPPPPPLQESKPELQGYDQAHSPSRQVEPDNAARPEQAERSAHERKREAELFAYIDGENASSGQRSGFRLGKSAIVAALLLAGCAIAAAPQAPWHPKLQALWSRGHHAAHAWLNPQPVTVAVAPPAHEDFGRPGDEYKLPVAENIPDATTDPSQVQVVPVVDPTAKKPNPDPAVTDPTVVPADTTSVPPIDGTQPSTKAPEPQPGQSAPDGSPQAVGPSAPRPSSPAPSAVASPINPQPHTEVATATPPPTTTPATPVRHQPTEYAPIPTKVPSSLQSQMVSMTPEASGNKPAEAALPAIEPVDVPELTERALLLEQPSIGYPATARGQRGTVILHVLVGRDGTVQDAKFLQGSLAFARVAIDGVKQWKFKPYTMNGRPVSVQTLLTLKFQPGQ